MIARLTGLFALWTVLGSAWAWFIPAHFLWVVDGTFRPFDQSLVSVLLGVIMLGMGLTLSPDDFRRVATMPRAVAIGVVTLYALVAVQLTAVLRRRLPTRLWRGVHVLSYALVWGALIHAGAAGSDTVNRGYQVLALVLTMLVVAATILRIVSPGRGTHATPADRATVGPGSHP